MCMCFMCAYSIEMLLMYAYLFQTFQKAVMSGHAANVVTFVNDGADPNQADEVRQPIPFLGVYHASLCTGRIHCTAYSCSEGSLEGD